MIIKPCPFCGETPVVELSAGHVPTVNCPTENCIYMIDLDSPFCDEVLKRWNTRWVSNEDDK